MITDEILLIERIGMSGAAFLLVYVLLKKMQERVFDLAENTIKQNTTALERMNASLTEHIKQKEPLIEIIKREHEKLSEIIDRLKHGHN